jgi:hypothetical protein
MRAPINAPTIAVKKSVLVPLAGCAPLVVARDTRLAGSWASDGTPRPTALGE